MDGRRNNGGNKNAGRKSKAQEQKLIEKLSPLDESAFKAFKKAIKEDKPWAIKMYMEYRYGKPHQTTDITTGGEALKVPTIKFT